MMHLIQLCSWFCRVVIEGRSMREALDVDPDSSDSDSDDIEQSAGQTFCVADGEIRLLQGGIDEYARAVERRLT